MRTIIPAENDNDDKMELELTNENFDNLNFINLSIWKNGDVIEGMPVDVSIDDLMSALIGFEAQRSRQ